MTRRPMVRPLDGNELHRITAEAVEAYRIGMATQATRDACEKGAGGNCPLPWTEFCADCAANYAAFHDLHRALGLKPWELSPLWVDEDGPVHPEGTAAALSWKKVKALKGQLEAALKAAVGESVGTGKNRT